MDKFIEWITTFLDDFDFAKMLPELEPILTKADGWIRFMLFIGPILLLALGLWYFFVPPKEANHTIGFQAFFGKGSVSAWRFTQRLCGGIWGALGIILLFVMVKVNADCRGLGIMDLAVTVIKQLFIQACLVLVIYVILQVVVGLFFTFGGKPRFKKNM